MKKFMVAITAFMLCLAGISAGGNVQAESIGSLKEKKSTIEKKKSSVESNISETESKISDIKNQRASIEAELKKVEKSISETKEEIAKKDKEIASTKDKIASLKESIKETEERIANRNEILKERARAYQQNGGSSSYLEVLLGANSFGEFVERLGAVTTIMNADKDIIAEQEADKARLEEQKAEVEEKLASLNKMMDELVKMKEKLDGQKIEKNKLMAVLKSEQAELEDEKLSLEEEKEILANQESAVKKAIEAEKKRQEAAAAAAAAASANSSSSSSGSSGTSGAVSSAPAVTSGKFMRPAAGYVSSRFGSRWGRNHNGIDIAKSGTVPVVASAAGVVSRANYSSSYGNVVYINHYIDGQVYTTVYAHLRSMNVSAGQSVKKGQQIGLMGNTGRSFGQHLHFELYVGGWTASKSNVVDPMKYLSGM
ncbi:peptidase M23 [Pradoshia eiseniae]|uniref:Peptidase M23 n=1 Tax=Pradoshia eiseniae TaxID=2064768 RepID=A0A2S7N2L7_9BACI|nr:M23 family metallopeptidase [Pradoshia eiseniae]PQD96257.1 peptidase M23 [Pradoshia eiseniae]